MLPWKVRVVEVDGAFLASVDYQHDTLVFSTVLLNAAAAHYIF